MVFWPIIQHYHHLICNIVRSWHLFLCLDQSWQVSGKPKLKILKNIAWTMFSIIIAQRSRWVLLSRWEDSNKWSNIGFGEEKIRVESIEVHFTHLIWCYVYYKLFIISYMLPTEIRFGSWPVFDVLVPLSCLDGRGLYVVILGGI